MNTVATNSKGTPVKAIPNAKSARNTLKSAKFQHIIAERFASFLATAVKSITLIRRELQPR